MSSRTFDPTGGYEHLPVGSKAYELFQQEENMCVLAPMRCLIYCLRIFLFVILGLCLLAVPMAAQEVDDAVTLVQSAAPTELNNGEEAEVTLTVTGQEAGKCIGEPQPADIVLVMDVSTSMDDEDKLVSVQQSALQFVANVDLNTDQIAVVAFSDTGFTVQAFTQRAEVARQAIEGLSTIDGTDIAAGLSEAVRVAGSARRQSSATANIVLLSDGQSGRASAQELAEQAENEGIRIYTISLGSNADQALMEELASSPSYYHHAPTADELGEIYEAIRVQIETAAASDVVIHTVYNDDVLEVVKGSLSPAGVFSGNHITWTLSTLPPGQQQALSFRVRTEQAGEFPATRSTDVSYVLCGDQPHSFTQGVGPVLTVTAAPTPVPTISPCTEDPLSNDCVSSLLCLGGFTWPCTTLGLSWWVCLLLLLLPLLAFLLWLLWRRKEKEREVWRRPQVGAISAPSLDASQRVPVPQPSAPPDLTITRSEFEAQIDPTLVIGLGETGTGILQTLRETLHEAYGEVPSEVHLMNIDVQALSDNHQSEADVASYQGSLEEKGEDRQEDPYTGD